MYDIPAVVFAGGKSSRMGEDKALLPFKGFSTLSEFQYNKLQQYFHAVYISSKENKFDFECKLILDTHQITSPLVALVSLFDTLDTESVFVLSVDAPLVDEKVLKKLFDAYDTEYDAIIAQSPNGVQPLCGIYTRSILPLTKKALIQDSHKLTQLLNNAHTKFVHFDDESLFTNLNYKHEYEKLVFH